MEPLEPEPWTENEVRKEVERACSDRWRFPGDNPPTGGPSPSPDNTDDVAAVRAAIAEFERGEGRPAREALEELRAKHSIVR
jgi:hypothetical protein